jgi:predicted ArsR family transcriptional regulator
MRTKPLTNSGTRVAQHLRATITADTAVVDDHAIGAHVGIEADTVRRALLQLEQHGALRFSRHRTGPGSARTQHGRHITLDWTAPIWAYVDAIAALNTQAVAR